MPHASDVVHCAGPDDPHAFDLMPVLPRNGSLDARCPRCHGHGGWNATIDLVSFRCTRAICDRCNGAGWVETGSDPIGLPDIEIGAGGAPVWTTRYVPAGDATAAEETGGPLATP